MKWVPCAAWLLCCVAVYLMFFPHTARYLHLGIDESAFFHQASYEPREHDVSIVTHFTLDRLESVLDMCQRWRAPISAVALLSRPHEWRLLREFHEAHQVVNKYMDIHVVFVEHPNTWGYRANLLRNVGMMHARTRYVIMLDADFVSNPTMSDELRSMVPMLSANPKIAVVVAAFETVSSEAEDTAGGRPNPDGRHSIPLPETQAELKQQLQRGFVRPVHQDKCVIAHRTTNYELWAQSTTPYVIQYEYMYEPYILIDKTAAPWYDETFIGYGNDKTSFTYELMAAGFDFYVAPYSFIVHLDHGIPSWREFGSYYWLLPWTRWASFLVRIEEQYSFRMDVPEWLKEECTTSRSCPAFWEW